MPDINVVFPDDAKEKDVAVDRAKVEQALMTIGKVAKGIAAITPNKTDDKIVELMEMFIKEEWFLDLIMLVIDLMDGKDKEDREDIIGKVRDALKVTME